MAYRSVKMEIRTPEKDLKQVRNQLVMFSVLLLMFVPILFRFIMALPLMHPTAGNLAFAVAAICLLVLLIAASGWYWILFAIHVRYAQSHDFGIDIERFFAPRVRFPRGHVVVKKAISAPSFNAAGFQRGTLIVAGMSSFYLPDNLPHAQLVHDRLQIRGGKQISSDRTHGQRP